MLTLNTRLKEEDIFRVLDITLFAELVATL